MKLLCESGCIQANGDENRRPFGSGARLLRAVAAPQSDIISIGRDGVVRRESSGIRLLAASNAAEENAEDLSMYKSDVTFARKEKAAPG